MQWADSNNESTLLLKRWYSMSMDLQGFLQNYALSTPVPFVISHTLVAELEPFLNITVSFWWSMVMQGQGRVPRLSPVERGARPLLAKGFGGILVCSSSAVDTSM